MADNTSGVKDTLAGFGRFQANVGIWGCVLVFGIFVYLLILNNTAKGQDPEEKKMQNTFFGIMTVLSFFGIITGVVTRHFINKDPNMAAAYGGYAAVSDVMSLFNNNSNS